MNWTGKRILVTGAGGFIGSHLTEALVAAGASVRAFVRYNGRSEWGHLDKLPADVRGALDVVAGDVVDPFIVDRAVADREVVFHLAALIAIPYSYVAPQSYVDVNVKGTLNVLEACRRHETPRLLHTSTSETYGTAIYTPIDEDHPLQGQSPYSASKIGADKLAESYFRSFALPVVTVRPFNTYGPRQSARAVIPTIITQALAGQDVKLGSLSPVRDLTFVTDTAAGFMALAGADAAVGSVVNLANGAGITVGDLAAKILAQVNPSARVLADDQRVRPEKSEVFTLIGKATRARTLAGWAPQVSLDEGLRRTIAYLIEHLGSYKPGTYAV